MKRIALALLAASSASLFAAGGNQSSATAQVGVKIVSPILIVNPDQSKLDFGTITVADASKAVEVAWIPDAYGSGTATYTNADPYADAKGNGPSSFAWFHVRKDHDLAWSNVNIAVPAKLTLSGGTGNVTVDLAKSSNTTCYTLNGQPAYLSNTTTEDMQHFYVGGTLKADANSFGVYAATMTVTANYQ